VASNGSTARNKHGGSHSPQVLRRAIQIAEAFSLHRPASSLHRDPQDHQHHPDVEPLIAAAEDFRHRNARATARALPTAASCHATPDNDSRAFAGSPFVYFRIDLYGAGHRGVRNLHGPRPPRPRDNPISTILKHNRHNRRPRPPPATGCAAIPPQPCARCLTALLARDPPDRLACPRARLGRGTARCGRRPPRRHTRADSALEPDPRMLPLWHRSWRRGSLSDASRATALGAPLFRWWPSRGRAVVSA